MKKHRSRTSIALALIAALLPVIAVLATCGGGGGGGGGGNPFTPSLPSGAAGTVTTTLSDPPTCQTPTGSFKNVWLTVTRVRANLSANAGPNDTGWIDLADLRNNPMQIDLLSTSATACTLATLGSTAGLPSGSYQQIRFFLLSNNPFAGDATPTPNQCGRNGFNCVVLADGTTNTLQLSSEATTGIKIPPGQIAGGAITLASNQAANINIDFNACDSIVQQRDGQLRLKTTLTAGQVSANGQSITGRVVDKTTSNPILNANSIVVFAEQPDTSDVDRVKLQALANPLDGTFTLCPLAQGTYDIVVAALSGSGTAQVADSATIAFNVPVGTNLGDIPLVHQAGASTSAGTIQGLVTASSSSNTPTLALLKVSPLQQATPIGGTPLLVTIPTFPGSVQNVVTEGGASCPNGTNCANYALLVPASNPSVGTFSSFGTTYSPPAAGNALYTVNGQAFLPFDSSSPDCTPSSITTAFGSGGGLFVVPPGQTVTAATLVFTGCQ